MQKIIFVLLVAISIQVNSIYLKDIQGIFYSSNTYYNDSQPVNENDGEKEGQKKKK